MNRLFFSCFIFLIFLSSCNNKRQHDYDYRKISSLVENYESIFQDLFGNQVTHDLKNADCMIETKKATKQTPLKSFLIVSDLRGETISVRPLIN